MNVSGKHARVWVQTVIRGGTIPVRLVSAHVEKPHSWLGAAVLLALVLMALSFVPWSLISPFRVYGDVVAQSATMNLDQSLDVAADMELDPARPGEISGFTAIDERAVSPGKPYRLSFPDSISSAELSSLSIKQHGNLTLRSRIGAHGTDFDILMGGPGGATTTVLGRGPSHVNKHNEVEDADPELITAHYDGRSKEPMRLTARLAAASTGGWSEDEGIDRFTFEGVRVSNLHFSQPSTQQDGDAFVSSIRSGSVTVLGSGEKHDLSIASPLVLTGFKGAIVRLSVNGEGIHVIFSGDSRGLDLGPADFSQDATPSVLDILAHRRGIQLGCGIFVAVVTALIPIFLQGRKKITTQELPSQQPDLLEASRDLLP